MTFQELFINNLKGFRKLHKISQARLAELCESSQAYIAEIEVGKKFPSPEMIERISKALNIESYCLFQNIRIEKSKTLSPSQKKEIAGKIYDLVSKIVDQY